MYAITVTNTGLGKVDTDSVVIADPIPANTELYVGNLGGSPAGPITYSDAGSSLTFTEFSKDNGTTWTYTPVPDANGYDALVTNMRFNPKGRMAGWSGSGAYPSFSLGFKVRLK